MTGGLVLALPGLLCAVMAWDLSRPTSARGRPRLRERTVAVALAVCAGCCVLAAGWDAAATRGPDVLGAICLAACAAASRSRLAPGAPTAAATRAKEPA